MKYNILECRVEYHNRKIFRINVLVEMSKGDVRAIYADTIPKSGYKVLSPNEVLSDQLLQEVAGYGAERRDKDDIFPGWHAKLAVLRSHKKDNQMQL